MSKETVQSVSKRLEALEKRFNDGHKKVVLEAQERMREVGRRLSLFLIRDAVMTEVMRTIVERKTWSAVVPKLIRALEEGDEFWNNREHLTVEDWYEGLRDGWVFNDDTATKRGEWSRRKDAAEERIGPASVLESVPASGGQTAEELIKRHGLKGEVNRLMTSGLEG